VLQWSDQGVLLLNAALTVRAHEANSHAKKGWQELTTAAIKALSARRRGLVFLLWGKNAQAVEPLIAQGKHHVLKSVHPSGLSAHRVNIFSHWVYFHPSDIFSAIGQNIYIWI
jgi:uracil-DNA glycosylase